MKSIVVFQESGESITLLDDDSTDLSEYSQNLTALLEISNVSILETSEGSLIARPSKINFIKVSEVKEELEVEEEPPVEEKEEPTEEHIDIITDGG